MRGDLQEKTMAARKDRSHFSAVSRRLFILTRATPEDREHPVSAKRENTPQIHNDPRRALWFSECGLTGPLLLSFVRNRGGPPASILVPAQWGKMRGLWSICRKKGHA